MYQVICPSRQGGAQNEVGGLLLIRYGWFPSHSVGKEFLYLCDWIGWGLPQHITNPGG